MSDQFALPTKEFVRRPESGVPATVSRPVAFEGASAVLFHHIWLCEGEYWRMQRALGRGRPLQRVYARLRRIVIMLDLAWACQGEDLSGTTLRAIESLMTWNPTTKKGMRLPLPAEVRFRAAMDRMDAIELPARAHDAITRLRDLPENPVDWWVRDETGEPGDRVREASDNLHACRILLSTLFRRPLDRILPATWDWVEIGDEGTFKLMSFNNCDISVAQPASGVCRSFNLPDHRRPNHLYAGFGYVLDQASRRQSRGRSTPVGETHWSLHQGP